MYLYLERIYNKKNIEVQLYAIRYLMPDYNPSI